MSIPVRKLSLVMICGLWATTIAHARPDDGTGRYTYGVADELQFWDVPDSNVRVHFSVDGPNATLLEDDDDDGVPDFPALRPRGPAERCAPWQVLDVVQPVFHVRVLLNLPPLRLLLQAFLHAA